MKEADGNQCRIVLQHVIQKLAKLSNDKISLMLADIDLFISDHPKQWRGITSIPKSSTENVYSLLEEGFCIFHF